MDNLEKLNSAAVKAMFSDVVERVRIGKRPVIVQKHNRDQVAIVPLEHLRLSEQKKSGE